MTTIIVLSILLALAVAVAAVLGQAYHTQVNKRLVQSNRADAQRKRADDYEKIYLDRVDDYAQLEKETASLHEQLRTAQEELQTQALATAEMVDNFEDLKVMHEKVIAENISLTVRVEEAQHCYAMAQSGSKAHEADKEQLAKELELVKASHNALFDENKARAEELARATATRIELETQLDKLTKQMTAATDSVLGRTGERVGYVDHPNGNRVFFVVVTPDEVKHHSYLSWTDQQLGVMMRGRMVKIADAGKEKLAKVEEGNMNFTAAALLIISGMLDADSQDAVINLKGITTTSGEPVGDGYVSVGLGEAPDTWRDRYVDLVDAISAIYFAAYWSPDRAVDDADKLWERVREAAQLEPGLAASLLGDQGEPQPDALTVRTRHAMTNLNTLMMTEIDAVPVMLETVVRYIEDQGVREFGLAEENRDLAAKLAAHAFDKGLARSPLGPTNVPTPFDIGGVVFIPRDQHDAMIVRVVDRCLADKTDTEQSVNSGIEASVEDDERFDTSAE